MGAPHGTCLATDTAGDQISADFVHDGHVFDAKIVREYKPQ
jgi:hypothetical protein